MGNSRENMYVGIGVKKVKMTIRKTWPYKTIPRRMTIGCTQRLRQKNATAGQSRINGNVTVTILSIFRLIQLVQDYPDA